MLANTRRSRGWLVLLGLLVGAGVSAAQSGHAQQTSRRRLCGFGSRAACGARIRFRPPARRRTRGRCVWRGSPTYRATSPGARMRVRTGRRRPSICPLRQGAQIWVSDGGRAEIQFDDGSLLRLGTARS